MNSRTIKFANALLLLAAATGCGNKTRENEKAHGQQPRARNDEAPRERTWKIDRPAPTTAQTETKPLPVEVKPTLVKRGPAPLVYIVETPASIVVVDLNTEQRLGSSRVPARTIVRVEPRGGVIFGEQVITPGPLSGDHEYGIYVESDSTSEIRNQTVAPMPRERQPQKQPQPQTRPQ